MAGLVPAIHVGPLSRCTTWMPGTSPIGAEITMDVPARPLPVPPPQAGEGTKRRSRCRFRFRRGARYPGSVPCHENVEEKHSIPTIWSSAPPPPIPLPRGEGEISRAAFPLPLREGDRGRGATAPACGGSLPPERYGMHTSKRASRLRMHPHPTLPRKRERADGSPLPLAGEGWVGVVPPLRRRHRAIDTGMSRCVHAIAPERERGPAHC